MQQIEVRVKGHIDADWSGWLAGLAVSHAADGNTVLTGQVPDQPALYGLLNRLSDLGIQLVSISAEEANERDIE